MVDEVVNELVFFCSFFMICLFCWYWFIGSYIRFMSFWNNCRNECMGLILFSILDSCVFLMFVSYLDRV